LPVGSVRALLTLTIVLLFALGRVPVEVLLLVLGFYFGQRGARHDRVSL
jgi:uncharacterized membrane protein